MQILFNSSKTCICLKYSCYCSPLRKSKEKRDSYIATVPFSLVLQKAFDKDWEAKKITYEGWLDDASDEGVIAYKLLAQTGEKETVNRSIVCRSCLCSYKFTGQTASMLFSLVPKVHVFRSFPDINCIGLLWLRRATVHFVFSNTHAQGPLPSNVRNVTSRTHLVTFCKTTKFLRSYSDNYYHCPMIIRLLLMHNHLFILWGNLISYKPHGFV